jgi:8-oxo-dGTP diphosphatase
MLVDDKEVQTHVQAQATSATQAVVTTKHGVGVIIIRDDEKVLLGQRKGSHGAGSWGFPGGHPEADETLIQCAQRETLEETGLQLTSLSHSCITRDTFAETGVEYITHFIVAKYAGGIVEVKEPHKCEQWCWLSWSEVCALGESLFKPIQSLLKLNFLSSV